MKSKIAINGFGRIGKLSQNIFPDLSYELVTIENLNKERMNIIAKYTHGSADSTDVDVCYVVDKLPSFQECKAFCDEDRTIENRNLIVVTDGVVTECYKGSVDEINNALLQTYYLHEQEFPLLITEKIPRDKCLKYIRAVRIILSHLSRSQYRPEVKEALRSDNFIHRLDVLRSVDFNTIDFTTLNKKMTAEDIKKTIAFQLGQCLGLLEDVELYTKKDIMQKYNSLTKYLYREENTSVFVLEELKKAFIEKVSQQEQFIDNEYDIKLEKIK